ncbi:acetoacetate--CoA ligase [Nakamurella flava]|uniref:Acetoacetate--CoA ligase n=1 Tax=Nakamurella flava TaxID=2576308 RepID=A0A4U6QL50_9ACTN|nr:acetoacetate--CoA ligase [Nakamurella flava]TKV61260.1 acetoacetate--CoA ligase [Nakamurella flava]
MQQQDPTVLWSPTDAQRAGAAITDFAAVAGDRSGQDLSDYADLWRWSTEDLEGFWGTLAEYVDLIWHDRPTAVLPEAVMPGAHWFPGGTLNYAEHALRDTGPADTVVVIAVAEDGSEVTLTRSQLRARVGAAQAGLARLGVGAGDRVVALVPNSIEAVVGFLATAALGGVWSSCSPDFGAHAVLDRFTQIEPTVLLAVDGYRYGGREFAVDATVAALRERLPSLAGAVHIPTLGSDTPDGMVPWSELTAQAAEPTFTPVPFEAPLWVLYSSGTTGLPKPIVQSVGGILVEHYKSLRLQWDIGPGDRFLWFTTTGWMMWNFLVGGLLVGAGVVLYDGSPGHPDLMTLWRVVERHRVNVFGMSAAFVGACAKAGVTPGRDADLSSVRVLGSTGSPLDDNGFRWLADNLGPDVPIVSFSGGTDICTGIVGGAPTVPVWLGEISCRALGAKVEAFSPEGTPLIGEVGELVMTAPLPSMPVALWGDTDGSRLREAYYDDFPGVWRHGDWIRITGRGSCVIEGRSDATLNRGGVRMGTAEFYRVTEGVAEVRDSLVVDTSGPHGEGDLILFVVLDGAGDEEQVRQRLRAEIKRELSPRHVPGRIIPVPAIPRTLNGKKCEVPVKRILAGTPVESAISRDVLSDPEGFDAFLAAASSALNGS